MKLYQLFVACILLAGSTIVFADCGNKDPFTGEYLKLAQPTYEGNQAILDDDDIADVPADWLTD